MDNLVRLSSASSEIDVMNGVPYANENLFEVYTQRLLKRSDFDKIYEITRLDYFNDQGIKSVRNSYYQFWHKRSGHTFWVKCEFRIDYDDRFYWPFPDYLKCHKQFQEDVWPEKVFIVIGFGRRPLKPSLMFCMPLDQVEDCGMHPKALEKHERDPTQPFDYQGGRLF
jgi:hypothetical protein